MGNEAYGIDPDMISRIAGEIAELSKQGTEVAIVIGGGNIFRGTGLAASGIDRVTADHMGMLATIMNSLAMQDALERLRRLYSSSCCAPSSEGARCHFSCRHRQSLFYYRLSS
jgi:uridylate kinase